MRTASFRRPGPSHVVGSPVRTPPSRRDPPPPPDQPAGAGRPAEPEPAAPSFTALLSQEIERSRRYYRGFGLLRVRWTSAHSGTALLDATARAVRRADLVAPAPGGGLYVLLPETPASGMAVVSRRLEEELRRAWKRPLQIEQAAYPRDGETPGELLGALAEGSP